MYRNVNQHPSNSQCYIFILYVACCSLRYASDEGLEHFSQLWQNKDSQVGLYALIGLEISDEDA